MMTGVVAWVGLGLERGFGRVGGSGGGGGGGGDGDEDGDGDGERGSGGERNLCYSRRGVGFVLDHFLLGAGKGGLEDENDGVKVGFEIRAGFWNWVWL